jgi:hypothetical protein
VSIRGRPVSIARLLLTVFTPVAWVVAASSAAAATVSVDVDRRGDVVVIEASAQLKADGATAWRVLTDYDGYGDFIPGVRSSHVVARRGGAVTVEQSDAVGLWLLRLPLRITYEIAEYPPTRLRSNATASALPALESSYVLTPTAFGVRLDYVGHVGPGWALLGRIEQEILQRDVVRQFQALADEIERRSARTSDAD